MKCPNCNGTGSGQYSWEDECPQCGGRGVINRRNYERRMRELNAQIDKEFADFPPPLSATHGGANEGA